VKRATVSADGKTITAEAILDGRQPAELKLDDLTEGFRLLGRSCDGAAEERTRRRVF
jgi:hypothetical protein